MQRARRLVGRRGLPQVLPPVAQQQVMDAYLHLGRSQLAPPPGWQKAPRLRQRVWLAQAQESQVG